MSETRDEVEYLISNQDDPPNAAELDRLSAKLIRLNREAELLGEAMRQKPGKS